MIRINLLPDIILKQRQEKRLLKLANLGLAAWGALLLIVLLLALGYRGWQTIRLNNANNTFATIDAEVNSAENVAFRTEARAVQDSLNTLSRLFLTQQMPSGFLAVLAANAPSGVQLVDLSIREGNRVSITGQAVSYAEVSRFVAALKNAKLEGSPNGENYFTFVELSGANLSGENLIAFEISAAYTDSVALEQASEEAEAEESEGETEGGEAE